MTYDQMVAACRRAIGLSPDDDTPLNRLSELTRRYFTGQAEASVYGLMFENIVIYVEEQRARESTEAVVQPTEAKAEWLIWSNEHGAWWGPDQSGYYHHPIEAGRYTLERAKTLCKSRSWEDRIPPETMIHIDAVVYGLPERTRTYRNNQPRRNSMAKAMNKDDILRGQALSLAIDYHRTFENGAAVAAVQRGKTPESAKPDCVVATAKVFHAFLNGK